MRDVVKGEDSTDKKKPQRAVNFQKSCDRGRHEDLLFRVDDTLTTPAASSHIEVKTRMRGGDNEPNETRRSDAGEESEKEEGEEKRRRRLSDVGRIDAVDVDEAATDVLFAAVALGGVD